MRASCVLYVTVGWLLLLWVMLRDWRVSRGRKPRSTTARWAPDTWRHDGGSTKRVASPKQKGKVERMVPDARELYKRLDALHPQATLEELNEHARLWCLQKYGGKKHGTTGIPPRQAFEEIEKHRADRGLSHVIGQAITLRLHSPAPLRRLLEIVLARYTDSRRVAW